MKNLALAFALLFVVASTSFAGTNTSSAASVAKELAVVLKLNEGQYLKIKNLLNARLEEENAGKIDVKTINDKFTTSVLLELTDAQQEAYRVYLASGTAPALASLTK